MVKSPTGIIPEDLMEPRHLGKVLEFLRALPIEGDDKVDLLLGWARAVGAKVSSSQRRTVRLSGVDFR